MNHPASQFVGLSSENFKAVRRLAIQYLYQIEANKQTFFLESSFEAFDRQMEIDNQIKPVVLSLVKKCIEDLSSIDEMIEGASKNWKLNRLGKVDLAVLRVCLCETMLRKDLHADILVADAVEIGKLFGTTGSGAFIHGVLDSALKSICKNLPK